MLDGKWTDLPANRVGDEAEKVGNRVGDDAVRVGGELTDRQYAILALLEQTPSLTVRALAVQVGISTRKIEANLAKLKAAGYLLRLGTPRSGQWQVMPFPTKPR